MSKTKIIRALQCCMNDKCQGCPYGDEPDCVMKIMADAINALEGNEVSNMAYGCLDTEKDAAQLRAEREKMLAEIDYQRKQLAEVLQENKLLQAQMHIVHLIFGRRTGNE